MLREITRRLSLRGFLIMCRSIWHPGVSSMTHHAVADVVECDYTAAKLSVVSAGINSGCDRGTPQHTIIWFGNAEADTIIQ